MHNKELLRYAGLATQILVTLGVAIFMGYKADHAIGWKFPLLTIMLPLLSLMLMFWKIYKDSSNLK